MADMIRDGASWLEGKRRAHMAVTVVYRAGGSLVDISLLATVSTANRTVMDAAGQYVTVQTRTFTVSTADLPDTPKRDDKITLTEGGVTRSYIVASSVPGEPVWSWGDRLHLCRKITAVPA